MEFAHEDTELDEPTSQQAVREPGFQFWLSYWVTFRKPAGLLSSLKVRERTQSFSRMHPTLTASDFTCFISLSQSRRIPPASEENNLPPVGRHSRPS